MGMIIKVYISDLDREVNIATLNSDDNDSQSVTITSKLIKENQVAVKNNESDKKSHECKTSCINIEKTSYESNMQIEDESINQEKSTPDHESTSVINKGVSNGNVDEMLKSVEFSPAKNNTDSNERNIICGNEKTQSSAAINNTENNTSNFDFFDDDADNVGFSTEVSDETLGSIVSFLDQTLSRDESDIIVQQVIDGNVKLNSKLADVPEKEVEPIVRGVIKIQKSDDAMFLGNTETANSKENAIESNIRENEPESTNSSHNEMESDLPRDDVSDTTNQNENNIESDLQTSYEPDDRNKIETASGIRGHCSINLISQKDKKFDSYKNKELNSFNDNEIQLNLQESDEFNNSHIDIEPAENNKNFNNSSTVPHSEDKQTNVNPPVFTFFGNNKNIADEVNVLLHGITETDFQKDHGSVEKPKTTNIAADEIGSKTQKKNDQNNIGVENLQPTHADETIVENNKNQGTATDRIQENNVSVRNIIPKNSTNLCDESAEAVSVKNIEFQPPEKESDEVTSLNIENVAAECESTNCVINTPHESGYSMTFVQSNANVEWNVSFKNIKPDSVLDTANECNPKVDNSEMAPSKYKSRNITFLNKESDVSKRKRKTEFVSSESTSSELDVNLDNVVDVLTNVNTENNQQLKEYIVVDKVLGSRLNQETNLREFLLKPKICTAKDEPWSPIVDPETCVVSLMDYGRLFIQSTKMGTCAKRKKLARQSLIQNPLVLERVLEKRLVNLTVESKSDKDFDSDKGYCSSLTHSQIVDVPNEKSTDTCNVTADKNDEIAIDNTNSRNCVSPVEMKPFELGKNPRENVLAETVDTSTSRTLRHKTTVGRRRRKKSKRKIQTEAIVKHVNKMPMRKPVLCPVCSRSYVRETSLVKHMKTHKNDASEPVLRNGPDSFDVFPKQEFENEENSTDLTPSSPSSSELSLTEMSSERSIRRQKLNAMRERNVKRKRSVTPDPDIPKRIFVSPSNKFEIKENKLPKVKKTVTFTSDLHFSDDIEELENPIHVPLFPDQEQYKCEMCYRELGSKAALTRHLRIHSESSLFKCSECHRLFATHNELVVHKKVHKTVQHMPIQLPVILLHRLPF